jgi:hypothetical protein
MVIAAAPTRVELVAPAESVMFVQKARRWGAPIWTADEPRPPLPAPQAVPDVTMLGVLYGRSSG